MVLSLLPGGEKWREAPDEGMLLAPRLPHRPLVASHALGTSPRRGEEEIVATAFGRYAEWRLARVTAQAHKSSPRGFALTPPLERRWTRGYWRGVAADGLGLAEALSRIWRHSLSRRSNWAWEIGWAGMGILSLIFATSGNGGGAERFRAQRRCRSKKQDGRISAYRRCRWAAFAWRRR